MIWKNIKEEITKQSVLLGLIFFVFASLVLIANFTGFFVAEDVIYFDWNENWSVNDSFVRVSLNGEIYDSDVVLVNTQVVVDLSLFEFNSTGTGYVDLIVNSTVVNSTTFVIEEIEEEEIVIQEGFETFSGNPPTHDYPYLNTTHGLNLTTENLTVYNVSTADAESDVVKNIINWYKNGLSLTVLNVPFEGGSNNTFTKDYSPFGNNGTGFEGIGGSPYWNETGGYDGRGAYEFNKTNDMFLNVSADDPSLAFNLDVINGFTVEMRIKNGDDAAGFLIGDVDYSSFGQYWLSKQADGTLSFTISNNTWNTNVVCVTKIDDSEWHHVAVVVDSYNDILKIYIDGAFEKDVSLVHGVYGPMSGLTGSGKGVFIGDRTAFGGPWNGTIDEVRIWKRPLSGQQVAELYNNRTDFMSSETAANDTWYACMTPNDGTSDGVEKCSNNLTIIGNYAPTHDNPILNSTFGTNFTSENLTVYNQSTADLDGDVVKNIINWFRNNKSIMIVNSPFEGYGNESTKARDYVNDWNNTNNYLTWNSTGGYDGRGAYYTPMTNRAFIYYGLLDNVSNFTLSFRYMSLSTFDSSSPRLKNLFGKDNGNNSYFRCYLYDVTGAIRCEAKAKNSSLISLDSTTTSWQGKNWYNIVFRWDTSTGITLWVNGELEGSNDSVLYHMQNEFENCPENVSEFHLVNLGSYGCPLTPFTGYSSPGFINDTYDEFMLFNVSLTEDQIKLLYNNRTDMIHSSMTSVGETWQACMTPNDNEEDGAEKCSNNLTIRGPNNVPTVTNVQLNSTSSMNYSNGTLQTYWEFNDADIGDTEIDNETKWWKEGVLNTTFANFTFIEDENITTNETWNFSVRVYDGANWSLWSENVTIYINAVPSTTTTTPPSGGGGGGGTSIPVTEDECYPPVSWESYHNDMEDMINVPVYDHCTGVVYMDLLLEEDVFHALLVFFQQSIIHADQYLGFNISNTYFDEDEITQMDIVFEIENEWLQDHENEECPLEHFGLEYYPDRVKYYADYMSEDDNYTYFVVPDIKEFGRYYISSFDCIKEPYVEVENITEERVPAPIPEEEVERTLRELLEFFQRSLLPIILTLIIGAISMYYIVRAILTFKWFGSKYFKTDPKDFMFGETNFGKLKSYLVSTIAKNMDLAAAKKNLMKEGWDINVIEEVIVRVRKLPKRKLDLFVYSKLGEGMKEQELLNLLVKKGWNENQVKLAIKNFESI